MIFFDTNLLIYSSTNQDERKQRIADTMILSALETNSMVISPLVLVEYIFVLAKINQIAIQQYNIAFFKAFSKGSINTQLISSAYEISSRLNVCKNINDAIHLKFAEQHCNKLITFDTDFDEFKKHTELEIEVLK